MSLKAFHLFFILSAIALCVWLAVWGLGRSNDGVSLGLGVGAVLSGMALTLYLAWFVKKLRNLSYLSIAVAALTLSQPLWACAVCFGDPNSPMVKSANTGILVLLGIVGTLLGGFASLFFYWSVRARRQNISAPVSALS